MVTEIAATGCTSRRARGTCCVSFATWGRILMRGADPGEHVRCARRGCIRGWKVVRIVGSLRTRAMDDVARGCVTAFRRATDSGDFGQPTTQGSLDET